MFATWYSCFEAAYAANIAIGAFLNLQADASVDNEPYLYHAYRMAFAEHYAGDSFSTMDRATASDIVKSVLIDSSDTTKLRIPNFAGNETLYLDFIDTSGMSTAEIQSAMIKWIDTTRAGFNKYVLGGHSSSSEILKAQVCKDRSVIFISPGAATESIFTVLNGEAAFAYGLLSSTGLLGTSTMEFLDSEMVKGTLSEKKYKIAILYENADHGRDYRDSIQSFVSTSSNFEIGYSSAFEFQNDAPDNTYKEYIDSLLGNMSAVVKEETNWLLLIDAHSNEFKFLQKCLARSEYSFDAISFGARGTDTSDIKTIIEDANSEIEGYDFARSLRYVFAGLWWSPGQQSQSTKTFINAWRKHEGQLWLESLDALRSVGDESFLFSHPEEMLAPIWYGTATGYDALRILLDALHSSKTGTAADFTTDAVRAQLERAKGFSSLLPGGKVYFPSTGPRQATNGFVIAQNQLVVEDSSTFSRTDITASELFPFIAYPSSVSAVDFRTMPSYSFTRPECESSDYEIFLLECNFQATYDYEIQYFDREGVACSSTNEACYCEHTQDVELVQCEYVPSHSSRATIIRALVGIGLIICATVLVILIATWNHPTMKSAHRVYYVVIVVLSATTIAMTLNLIGENTEASCKVRLGTLIAGFGFLLSFLAGRVFYWYRVWAHPTKENLRMGGLKLWWLPVASSFIVFVIVIVGISVSGTFVAEIELGYRFSVIRTAYVCTGGSNGFALANGAYLAVLIFTATLLSYQAKDVDGKHYDSRYVYIASFNTMFVSLLVGVILGLIDLGNVDIEVCIAISVTWVALGICIFSLFSRIGSAHGLVFFASKKNSGINSSQAAQSTNESNILVKYIHGRRSKRTTTNPTSR